MSQFPHKPNPNVVGPFEVLKRALAQVPAVKYALGVAGVGAAVAIIQTFFTDWTIAVFGIVIMLLLMAVLFVFAKLTTVASKDLRLAMLTLMWSSLILTISAAALLTSSVFFGWPINLRQVITPQSPVNKSRSDIYRVRVAIVDASGTPVVDPSGRAPDDLKVWSSISASSQPAPGGAELIIPYSIKPADGKLIIRASRENSFLTGETELVLGDDLNPTIKLTLQADESAEVGGQVVDYKNRAVIGARVYRVGYAPEAVMTSEGGNFVLPAHAARNQKVLLYAEKEGVGTADLWWPAGNKQAKLVLER